MERGGCWLPPVRPLLALQPWLPHRKQTPSGVALVGLTPILIYFSVFLPTTEFKVQLITFPETVFALCKLATTELTLQKEKNVVSWHTLLWLYFSKYQFLCLTASSRTMRSPSCRPEKLASLRGYCKSPKVAGK